MTGLDKNGKEPALKPFKLVVTGDMCFLQKMTATGGACKVKHFFCPCCECNGSDTGDDDMLSVVMGKGTYINEEQNTHHRHRASSDTCILCAYNGRTACAHRQVLDDHEIERKTRETKELLINDARHQMKNSNLHLRDLVSPELQASFNDAGRSSLPLSTLIRNLRHTEELKKRRKKDKDEI